jgi:magnesium chelatase family protein
VSEVGLVGGGDVPRPGEVSLAHHGVLFLDELPEFRRAALESLRQPLEDGVISVSRSQGRATFPARPLVVGAMNPCMCGFFGDPAGRCACPAERIRLYRSRLSGPLLDRIDVHVRLPPVSINALQHGERGEGSAAVRERVQLARLRQRERQTERVVKSGLNASLSARDLERVARLGPAAERILARAAESLGLSARAYGKVLRVARTIADLASKAEIGPEHVAEAVSLRVLDRRTDAAAAA